MNRCENLSRHSHRITAVKDGKELWAVWIVLEDGEPVTWEPYKSENELVERCLG